MVAAWGERPGSGVGDAKAGGRGIVTVVKLEGQGGKEESEWQGRGLEVVRGNKEEEEKEALAHPDAVTEEGGSPWTGGRNGGASGTAAVVENNGEVVAEGDESDGLVPGRLQRLARLEANESTVTESDSKRSIIQRPQGGSSQLHWTGRAYKDLNEQ